MEYKRFGSKLLARLDRGEEIVESLKCIAEAEGIALAHISALGATNDVTVGVFKTADKTYCANHFTGDMEIVSLTGTVSTMNGACYIHLHLAVGDECGNVKGGHLNRAVISATCEVVMDIIEGTVERRFDDAIGLNLFCLDA